ncbi:MAG: chromosomal replication initiator protein DnaA [Anaerolineae bacterium]|nr:chromosomal replication initiator protein DnaA [Anaerolineae bacterium]
MNAKDAWSATLGQLQVQLNRSTYDTWLRHADLLGYEDGRFVVTVPNAYVKDWIERHILPAMTETLSRIFRRPSDIQLIVWNPVEDDVSTDAPLFAKTDDVPDLDELPLDSFDALNPDYRFDKFVVGDANRYAALLGQAIIDSSIGKYSPVLFYGGMGMGKTHLLQSIARALVEKRYKVVYLAAEEFTTELVAAIRAHETLKFRERFRAADAVLIDDLQFIEGKDSTQNELVAIWDSLRNRQRTMIFAADRLPRDMVKITADARSRFQAGPIAAIDPPDWKLRCDVLDAKSQLRGFALPAELRDLLAERITGNVRDLEGAIDQLHTFSQLTRQPINLETARKVLPALGSASKERPVVTLERVLQLTASHFRLTVDDLASRKRTKDVALARQIAMYLAREETAASLAQIGLSLGGRDHTTILHGCAKVMNSLLSEPALAQDVRAIRDLLMRAEPEIKPVSRPIPQPEYKSEFSASAVLDAFAASSRRR